MQGRFNIFQKSMLDWNAMHPYSAGHVVRMRGVLDATRLRNCIHGTLERRGLTHLKLDIAAGRFQYDGGPADCEIRELAGASGARAALVAEVERQLNRPFDSTRAFSPFRFLTAADGDAFYLGLVYFHPVADAAAAVGLLKEILAAYAGGGEPGSGEALELYPDARPHLWRRHPGIAIRKLLNLPVQVLRLRASHRAGYRAPEDMANGFRSGVVAAEQFRALVATAKSWGVTVNDLLMAVLMQCLGTLAKARLQARKRRKLSLGCIVNLRNDLGPDSRRAFGVFLGSFIVTHEVPAGISLRQLAEAIRQQTAAVKRHKLFLGTPLELGLGRLLLQFFSPAQRKKFYPKNYPLWGGITNLNLNQLWPADSANAPLDYFRGVSTGPVTPLVLSATTIGERLNLGWSYRTTVFTGADIAGLQTEFAEQLKILGRAA
jgi:hypothetical protein